MPSPNPLYPTLRLKQSYTLPAESLFADQHQIGLLLLYYTVMSRPVLSPVPSHTYAHAHIRIWACVVFWMRACWTHHFEPDKSPPFQSLKSLGCCSFTSTALHCTGTAGWDWTGWRHLAWLPSERAKRLSYCAARLVSLSLSHHWILSTVHFQISTHWVPPSIPTRLSTPPPRTRLRHLLSSSLLSPPRTYLWAT